MFQNIRHITTRLIATILLLIGGEMSVCAQDNTLRFDKAFPFIVITGPEVDSLPVISDETFYRHSNSIIFEVNKTDVRYDDPFFDLYYTQLLPYINGQRLQLRKVFVRGAASPEGPYGWNRTLGEGRSRQLLTLLRKGLSYQYVKTDEEVNPITEDYGYLCILMREAADPDYNFVKRIYDECQGDELCCKERLMEARGGKLWKRLIHTYFPELRAARFILWFSEPDAEHAPAPVPPVDPAPVIIPARRDTIYLNDTLYVRQPVVVDGGAPQQPATAGPASPAYYCHGRIHIGCIHDPELHPNPVDTLKRHPLFALKTNLLFDVATFLNAEVEVPIRSRWSVVAEVVWPWWLQRSHNRWCNEMGSVSLEGRFWFRPWQYHSTFRQWHDTRRAPLTHGFVGAYVAAGYYDFQLPKTYDYPEGMSDYEFYRKGHQGEFVTAGVTFGVSRYIGRRLRFEASLGLGGAYSEFRRYHIDSNTEVEPNRDQFLWRDDTGRRHNYIGWLNFRHNQPVSDGHYYWLGPTKAKLSIVWLLTKPCRKAGNQKGGEL